MQLTRPRLMPLREHMVWGIRKASHNRQRPNLPPQPNPQVGTHDAGEFCKKADVGKVEYAKNGRLIVCEYRNNNKTPHWHYV